MAADAGSPAPNPAAAEIFDLNRRATALDANNRDLHAHLAESRQQVQLLQQQMSLVQKQLSETAQRLQQTQLAKDESERKYQELYAATTRRGGAVITANTSTRQALRLIEIPDCKPGKTAIRSALPFPRTNCLRSAQPNCLARHSPWWMDWPPK